MFAASNVQPLKLMGLTYQDLTQEASSPFSSEDIKEELFNTLSDKFAKQFQANSATGTSVMWTISAFIGRTSYRFLESSKSFYNYEETPQQIVEALQDRKETAQLVKLVIDQNLSADQKADAELDGIELQLAFGEMINKLCVPVLAARQKRYINNYEKLSKSDLATLFNGEQDQEVQLDYLIAYLEMLDAKNHVPSNIVEIYKNLSNQMRESFLEELASHPELCKKYWQHVIINTIDISKYKNLDDALNQNAVAWFAKDFNSKLSVNTQAALCSELAKFTIKPRRCEEENGELIYKQTTVQYIKSLYDLEFPYEEKDMVQSTLYTIHKEGGKIDVGFYAFTHATFFNEGIVLLKNSKVLEGFIQRTDLDLLVTITALIDRNEQESLSSYLLNTQPFYWNKFRERFGALGIVCAIQHIQDWIESRESWALEDIARLANNAIGCTYIDLEKYFKLHAIDLTTLAIIRWPEHNRGFSNKLLEIMTPDDIAAVLKLSERFAASKLCERMRKIFVEGLNLKDNFRQEIWETLYGKLNAPQASSSAAHSEQLMHIEYLKLFLKDVEVLAVYDGVVHSSTVNQLRREIQEKQGIIQEQLAEINRLKQVVQDMGIANASLQSEYNRLQARYESETSSTASESVDVNQQFANEDLRAQIEKLLEENRQLKSENAQLKGGRQF